MESTTTNWGASAAITSSITSTRDSLRIRRLSSSAQAPGSHGDLLDRLLAAYIEDRSDAFCENRRELQKERRLSDARFAADQHQGAGDDAAPKHPVELWVAQGATRLIPAFGLRHRDRADARGRSAPPSRPRLRRDLFDKSVPPFTRRTAPKPLDAHIAALLTHKSGSTPPWGQRDRLQSIMEICVATIITREPTE